MRVVLNTIQPSDVILAVRQRRQQRYVAKRGKPAVLRIRIRDPVAFLTPGSGMGKKSGSEIWVNQDHITESTVTIFELKYLYSLIRIQDTAWKKSGSWINIPDPHHWKISVFCGSGSRSDSEFFELVVQYTRVLTNCPCLVAVLYWWSSYLVWFLVQGWNRTTVIVWFSDPDKSFPDQIFFAWQESLTQFIGAWKLAKINKK